MPGRRYVSNYSTNRNTFTKNEGKYKRSKLIQIEASQKKTVDDPIFGTCLCKLMNVKTVAERYNIFQPFLRKLNP